MASLKETRKKDIHFKKSDIRFFNNLPHFLLNAKFLEKTGFFKWILRIVFYFMDYLCICFLKILKYFGEDFFHRLGYGRVKYEVVRLKEQLITMKDGAKLAVDIYLPKWVFKERAKAPTIFVGLPYWKKLWAVFGYLFSARGYVTILQDIRGCGNSYDYGTFAFTYSIRSDGFDTLNWIKNRFWYNGKIGTWGASFLGLTQLAISWDNDGLLTCMNPAVCAFTNMMYHSGGLNVRDWEISAWILFGLITQKWLDLKGLTNEGASGFRDFLDIIENPLKNIFNDPINNGNYLSSLKQFSEITDMQEAMKYLNETYGINLNITGKDEKRQLNILTRRVFVDRLLDLRYKHLPYTFGFDPEKIDTPCYWVDSWYDPYNEFNMREMELLQEKNPEFCRKKLILVIGPGGHAGMDLLQMNFPPTSLPKIREFLEIIPHYAPFWFFEYFLMFNKQDLLKYPTVWLYIQNKKIWRYFNTWPPSTHEMKLYLHSNGKANTRYGDGILSESIPGDLKFDEYDFNPRDPVPMRGGNTVLFQSGQVCQKDVESRDDVLVYTSDKLKEGLEIIGWVKIIFYASSSAKDTDFMVKLVDVNKKGKALNVIDGGIRARYREGLKNPTLLEPNKIYKYEVTVGPTAIYFPKGHKIRVQITSSNFPRYGINSNLAGEKKGYITARQTILHDSEHPSHLILPIFLSKKITAKI